MSWICRALGRSLVALPRPSSLDDPPSDLLAAPRNWLVGVQVSPVRRAEKVQPAGHGVSDASTYRRDAAWWARWPRQRCYCHRRSGVDVLDESCTRHAVRDGQRLIGSDRSAVSQGKSGPWLDSVGAAPGRRGLGYEYGEAATGDRWR